MSSFVIRLMTLCNTACSASSVGAGTATNAGSPLAPRRYSLDQRDRAAARLVGIEAGLPRQVLRDHAVHHLQHGHHQLGLCGQQ